MVLSKAIIHDIEEVITGDIPTPTKYHSEKLLDQITLLEEDAAHQVCMDVFDSNIIHGLWTNCKDGSMSGQIVRLADIAAVVYKIWCERQLGNTTFDKYLPDITQRIRDVDLCDDLEVFLENILDVAEDMILEIEG